jgi:Ni/Co efflux regulator RcnB
MKRVLLSVLAAVILAPAAVAQTAPAQATQAVNRSGAPEDTARIIRAFTQRESEFRKALNEYGFTREAIIQTLAWGGQISGEYRRDSRFVFDDSGNRFEKILFFPIPTVKAISVTPEDIEDLGGVQAFALEASKINEYDFAYVGKEKIDELNLYVFDVTPKILSDQKRLAAMKKAKTAGGFFQGRVWVDDRDYQIVKARGKSVPEFDQRFPTFETYREQIDGKYWFPTYAYADDELTFKDGSSVHVRMRIKYKDFLRLKGKLTVIEDPDSGEVKEDDKKPLPVPPIPKPKP